MRDNKILIASDTPVEIPFSFRPVDMKQKDAYIIIKILDDAELAGIKWQFPLKGRTIELFL